jgi:spermidine synthase
MLWTGEKHKNTLLGFEVKEVLHRERSSYQLVEIYDTCDWGRLLMLDGIIMTTERDEFFYHETISHLPASQLSSPPGQVLVVGGGDGGTVREVLKYPSVEQVDMVEIDEMVVEACRQHLPTCARELGDARCQLRFRDAAEFVEEAADASYDLVLCDSSDPAGFAEILIGSEFYRQILRILRPEGVFCGQTSSPLSQSEDTRRAWQNVRQTFPEASLAWSVIPTYPGSVFSFSLGSQQPLGPERIRDWQVPACRFWNPTIGRAMLSEPEFLRMAVPSS